MDLKKIALLFLLSVVPSQTEVVDKNTYRLQGNCIPHHYEIEITVPNDFQTSGKFTGKTKIFFTVTTEISEIEFHSNKLSYNKTNIHLSQSSSVNNNIYSVKQHKFNEKLHKVTVTFDQSLKEKNNYTLYIDHYEGVLDLDMLGFYRAKYKNSAGNFEWIAITQFEATHARRAFPCFDEPKYKATFNLVINHPLDYNALSNAEAREIRTFPDSKQTLFNTSPRMSTYTVAFAVTKYVSMSITDNKVKHAVWSSIETIALGQYALSVSTKLVAAMEGFITVPYTMSNLTTVNHLSIPDFSAGAMENWGLITYRETALLWNPVTSSARNKQRVGAVVAHELSHMWFGNLVTPDWWSFAWLNEGFARYFEYMALAEVEKNWDLQNQFIIEQHQRILVSDALDKSKPITNNNIFTPSEVSGMFDSTTYSKGGSIVRMMSLFLGKDAFYKGLQSYLSTYKFNSTVPFQLFNALENYVEPADHLPETVPVIMAAWTEKPGFPLVTVRLSGNNILLQQNQFGKANSKNSTKWFVPITYTMSKEKNFNDLKPKVWMNPNVDETVLNGLWNNQSWIILNIKSSAFIRINYDDTLWDGLQTALNKSDFDNIIPINRAQLVDDSMNLARANIISYKRALNVLSYLNKELDYYPWYSAFGAFSYLRRRIGHDTKLGQLLNKHIQGLMQNLYKNATSSLDPDDQIENHRQVLALSWGCRLNMKECVSKVQNMFNNFKKYGTPVNPNLRDVVFCSATRYATNKNNWEYLWKRLENNSSADEIPILISALGCTSTEDLLQKYLHESIKENSTIRRQDGQSVFNSVIMGNPKGVDIGLSFLISNFQNISTRYGGMNALSSVITGLADRLTTKAQVAKLESFIENNKDQLKDAITAAGTAIENAKKNLEWVDRNEKELLEYLQANHARFNSPAIVVVFIVAFVNIFKVF